MNAEEMKLKLQELKDEAQALLDEDKVEDAEAKTLEVKILNGQIEIQEELDKANATIEEMTNKVEEQDVKITELEENLETVNAEKEELMNKFTEATDTIAELNEKVNEMQPIVDEHNKKQHEEELENAKNGYMNKFSKVNGEKVFESEEIQNLVLDTINKDKSIANKAKYQLSEKLMEVFDKQDKLTVNNIQEPSKKTENLNPEVDDFEKIYGFKRK